MQVVSVLYYLCGLETHKHPTMGGLKEIPTFCPGFAILCLQESSIAVILGAQETQTQTQKGKRTMLTETRTSVGVETRLPTPRGPHSYVEIVTRRYSDRFETYFKCDGLGVSKTRTTPTLDAQLVLGFIRSWFNEHASTIEAADLGAISNHIKQLYM